MTGATSQPVPTGGETEGSRPGGRSGLTLLLTATITPHGVDRHLALADPSVRRGQYKEALSHALKAMPASAQLIFAENSGADLADFLALTGGRSGVEFLSLPPGEVPNNCGRGYLETRLVGDALRTSNLVTDERQRIVKLTGRYRVTNLRSVLDTLPADVDLAFNLRRFPRPWADMWLYALTPRGYAAIEEHIDVLREDVTFAPSESNLYYVLQHLARQGVACSMRFDREPRFLGVRGNDGVSYSTPRQSVKWAVRAVAKRALPRVWI